MSVIVTVEVEAADGNVGQLQAAFAEVLGDTRAFDGCQSVELIHDEDRPAFVVLFERWRSVDDFHRYKAWRTESGTSVVAGPLVVGSPIVRFFNILDT